MIWTNLLC